MERWIIRRTANREKTSDIDNSVSETTDEIPSEKPSTSSTSNINKGQDKRKGKTPQYDQSSKHRKYQEEFIKYGFTSFTINEKQHPQCVLCSEVLAHESLKPVKMKRHLQTKHPSHADKPIEFFRRKEGELQDQKQVLTRQTTISTKAQMASYEVAYLIAQSKQPHTIGETLMKPGAVTMSRIMHGDKMARELETVPLSNDTITRRINDIANDIKCQLIDRVKGSKYALQLDESTDISNSAQLLVFIRYSFAGKLQEDMLFCTVLDGTCTGSDIFTKLDTKIREEGLSWDQCVGVCTDGAGAMLGKRKGLKARVLQVAPHINFTHCIIHREALASKALNPELSSVLQTAIKIVNYIKTRPINARLFSTLCNEMGSEHEALLFHTEVRWLSRGKVLNRLYELRDEVRLFLIESESQLADHLTDPDWLANLAYLSCIFERLNLLNLSLQGPNTNILVLSDKIDAFTRKLERWAVRVDGGSVEMFPELEEFMEENELSVDNVKVMITTHLRGLVAHFKKYFPKETAPQRYDWIRQPFTATGDHLSSDMEDELLELSSDRTLQTSFGSTTLDEFWISVANEYPVLSKAAMDVLIPFGSTYLCEKTFSALTYIKNKYRSRLWVEDDLRVAISGIKPRMELLCSKKQAQVSH
ncbi:zinc finger BED domain-containing protein 5-like [Penaeus japonicus]|uniref:zinc finger BED domain-containing protein 5-like n=1 Tax=Penaeus japonicus TaxID=27405 RepID=UPI001C714C6E|nr:zinc finger BED domain-containing protein 5-like [Penaeus japonicus]